MCMALTLSGYSASLATSNLSLWRPISNLFREAPVACFDAASFLSSKSNMLMTNTSCKARGRLRGEPNVAHQRRRYKDVSRIASFGGKIPFPNSCPLLGICCTILVDSCWFNLSNFHFQTTRNRHVNPLIEPPSNTFSRWQVSHRDWILSWNWAWPCSSLGSTWRRSGYHIYLG